ncbi:MAG: hypothetical protein RIG62_21510 [Cyclobacteriaceae bacterium]
MRGRIIIAHVWFLITNMFVVIDFWQTHQKTDQVIDIQEKTAYHPGKSSPPSHVLGLYEVRTHHHTFTVPEKYSQTIEESATITVYCTRFLRIVRHIEVNNQFIPISAGLYAAISLAVVAIAIAALAFSRYPDFQSFTAIINVLLSLMVIYMIWF